jgi:hypothetical protein
MVTVSAEDAKDVFFNDLPVEQAEMWGAKLLPQSVGVFSSTTTYAAWRDIPSTYVVAEQDRTFFTPEVVSCLITQARALQPNAADVIETCSGGHCLMIGHSEWLSEVLRRAAGEKVISAINH